MSLLKAKLAARLFWMNHMQRTPINYFSLQIVVVTLLFLMASNGIWKKPSAKTCTRRKSQVRSLRIDPTCSSFRRGTSPGLLALTKMQKVNSMMHVFFPPRKRKQNPNILVFQKCIKFLSYHSYHSYHSHHHVWLHCTKSQLVQHVES